MALFTKNQRKHIFVHPAQQDKLHSAVKTALMKDKRKFSDKLEGALMDVSNLRVIGKHYLIVDGFLSMEVEADFQVFCPNIGMKLEGIVNKISRGHIGCLVMDLFNTSIAIPHNSSVVLNIGDKCEFSVMEVIIDGDILSLRGSLSDSYFQQHSDDSEEKEDKDLERKEKKDLERKEKKDNDLERRAFEEVMPDAEEVVPHCASLTNDRLFEQGVLTQGNPSVKKSPKKPKKGIKEERLCDDQKVIDTFARIDQGESGSRKKSKSPKRRSDKRHTINSPKSVIVLESKPSENTLSSPLKKSKKGLGS